MNCKPGDLAVGVSASPEKAHNIGLLVRVIDWNETDGKWNIENLSPCVIDGVHFPAGSKLVARDRHMRPIRDNDKEDETLTWAGKPNKVTA